MIIPMLSVHYVDGLGWTAGAVGLVLAARQFFQQGLTPFSGVLADRLGAKPLIAVGMLVRAAGFAAMAFAGTYGLLMAAAIVSAVGGALFESPRSAAVAALTDERERSSYFAKMGVVGGLGITAGTQLGALLLEVDFRLVALVSAATYVLIFVVTLLWLPAVQVAEKGGPFRGLNLAFRDRPFLTYTSFMGGHQFMAAQFSITLPLMATRRPSPVIPARLPGSTRSTPSLRWCSDTRCRTWQSAGSERRARSSLESWPRLRGWC